MRRLWVFKAWLALLVVVSLLLLSSIVRAEVASSDNIVSESAASTLQGGLGNDKLCWPPKCGVDSNPENALPARPLVPINSNGADKFNVGSGAECLGPNGPC